MHLFGELRDVSDHHLVRLLLRSTVHDHEKLRALIRFWEQHPLKNQSRKPEDTCIFLSQLWLRTPRFRIQSSSPGSSVSGYVNIFEIESLLIPLDRMPRLGLACVGEIFLRVWHASRSDPSIVIDEPMNQSQSSCGQREDRPNPFDCIETNDRFDTINYSKFRGDQALDLNLDRWFITVHYIREVFHTKAGRRLQIQKALQKIIDAVRAKQGIHANGPNWKKDLPRLCRLTNDIGHPTFDLATILSYTDSP